MQRQETSRSIKSEPRPKMASVALRWSDLIPPSRQPPIHTIYVSHDDRNHHLSDALSAAYLEARERSAASRRSCRTTASSWMKLIVSPPTCSNRPGWSRAVVTLACRHLHSTAGPVDQCMRMLRCARTVNLSFML
jgi:hypothetical protein